MSYATHLECCDCHGKYPIGQGVNTCDCGGNLLAQYDLETARTELDRDRLATSGGGMWKYRALLPASDPDRAVTLGEGGTPLVHLTRLGEGLGMARLYLKDEGINPTGTFKARGASVGLTMLKEANIGHAIIASSGNAGQAWSTYSARAGVSFHLAVPENARDTNLRGCTVVGADIYMVHGPRVGVGQFVEDSAGAHGWYDAGKDPYRVDGKKTIGYEIAEQLGWMVPDFVLYPTGGSLGPSALWKAFSELAGLGWTDGRMPRIVPVQPEGCYPVVRALRENRPLEPWVNPKGVANGILNPTPHWGEFLVEKVRETEGVGAVVTDDQILDGMRQLASLEGVLACPEGAATLPAVAQLRQSGVIGADDLVVLVSTGSAIKYPQLLPEPRLRHLEPGERV